MYKHIVFDVDGTLINTEYAVLNSLQDTLKEVQNKNYKIEELEFVLGITGEAAIKQLGIANIAEIVDLWNKNLNSYKNSISVFDGIKDLLQKLSTDYKLGIVTSKTKAEFDEEVTHFGLNKYFGVIICADATQKHKPNPEPLLKYMELANAKPEETLYVGDSVYDMQCAKSSGVDFAFAKWGNRRQNIDAKYTLLQPLDLLKCLSIEIIDCTERQQSFIDTLLDIWEKSVRATHLFLPESEILNIKEKFLPDALKNISHLVIAKENGTPVAFMGIEAQKLEMLFVLPEKRGKGIGKKLLKYGIKNYSINELTVNEQNPQAKGFYEHLGFKVYKREEVDEQGNPYPILYMQLIV